MAIGKIHELSVQFNRIAKTGTLDIGDRVDLMAYAKLFADNDMATYEDLQYALTAYKDLMTEGGGE